MQRRCAERRLIRCGLKYEDVLNTLALRNEQEAPLPRRAQRVRGA